MKKKFVVIGLGRFGFNVACKLAQEGMDIIAIDNDKDIVNEIRDSVNQAVVANATECETLKAIGVDEVDVAVLSLGSRLDNAMLVLLHLKEFKIPHILVKAISDDHGKIFELMGATEVVYPEKEVGMRVGERLAHPNVLERLVFSKGHSIAEIEAPEGFHSKTLKEIGIRANFGVVVAAIKKKNSDDINIAPSADDSIYAGDIMVVVGHDKDIDKLKTL